jgi:hypothetical protein
MILIDPLGLRKLPQQGGITPLGLGKDALDDRVSKRSAQELQKSMEKFDIQTWVPTDIAREPPHVSVRDNEIVVTGTPYFHFWRTNDGEFDVYREVEHLVNELKKQGKSEDEY